MKNSYAVIAFATTWGAKFGGINAFNTDFLHAIAAAHWHWLRVVCVVADCDENDIQNAKDQYQIELITLGLKGESLTPDQAEKVWSKLLNIDPNRTVWLGHDRITGSIANAIAKEYGGRSALIHHMSYDHYESFAENSTTANKKSKEQQELFTSSNVRLAVGPLLREALADFVDVETKSIPMLTPGLAEISPKQYHHTFTAFISGRLDAGAQKIKQAHLGVAGFAHAVWRCDTESGFPSALNGSSEPKIRLRGIDLESDTSATYSNAEQELKKFAELYAKRVINIQTLPFTQNRTELFSELRQASVCLMPSWHEGFGLVAWEAIAAGVPLILSAKSGVYRLLKDRGLDHFVCSIDIKGKNDFPFFTDTDKEAIASKLIDIAKDHATYKQKALLLREALLNDCTWRACADSFIQALKWEPPSIDSNSAITSTVNSSSKSSILVDHLLPQWLEQPKPQWQPEKGHHPSQLLRAEEALIPFAPEREPFLLTQCEWATSTPYPIGVRLLVGEGGVGKTRLALEMLHRLSKVGWNTGFFRHNIQFKDIVGLVHELRQTNRPTLIVLDYAETRSAALLELLAQLSRVPSAHSTRVLLLARSSGEWWRHLPEIDPRCETLLTGSATTGPYTVPGLYIDLASRKKAYAEALTTFSRAMECSAPEIQPNLQAAAYDKPLFLHMAALLALLGERTESADALPMALVRHEKRYWHKAVRSAIPSSTESEKTEKSSDLLMALVTLLGAATTHKSIDTLWSIADGDGDAQQLKFLFSTLTPLYPSTQGLSGLRPDLLGEALVAQQLLGSNGEDLLNAVLGSASSAAQRHHALTVLSRLLRYREDISNLLEQNLTLNFPKCAKDIIKVAIQTPSPLPKIAEKSFQRLSKKDALQVAGQLEDEFNHEILPLIGLAVLVRQSLYSQAQKRCESFKGPSEADWSHLAKTLDNLCVACYRDGDITSALEHARSALDINYRLARNYPKKIQANLAGSLNNYANLLSDNGDFTQALQHAKQALDIRERLAQENPDRFEADWAMSLSNYANNLADNGDGAQALHHAKMALDIRERLAQSKPDRFEGNWATSLNNYANFLSENGDFTLALQHAKKALDVRERLALDKPERFNADWAMSLNNYASMLSENGDVSQAVKYAKQALDIYQRLAHDKPERFDIDWAMSLSNYANFLGENGDFIPALQNSKLALDIRERLARDEPERFSADWAMSLSNYANRLADDGNIMQALENGKKALIIRENLANDKPKRFEDQLATSLNNYANFLRINDEFSQAQQHSKQALDIYQRLAQSKPKRFEADFAMALSNYSIILNDNGEITQALKNSTQALTTYQRLALEMPERFDADLANCLNNHAGILCDNGDITQAVSFAKQALDIQKKLAQTIPAKYSADADSSFLLVALCEWLEGQTNFVIEPELDPEIEVPYRQRSNRFYRNILVAFTSSTTIDCANHLSLAWQAWFKMSHAQKNQLKGLCLLGCAFESVHGTLPSSLKTWKEQLVQMQERRKGLLPAWMQMIAERKSFGLT
ncbi:tetratricopeptide repeat protein [Acidovorax sp. LjRoot118]|uniref:tetratricopeptide repeat protein n=1 Tax=Acidovorax sp. LjRoot118 TaxID=3342256 RepID=UPI003ECF6217